MKAGPVSYQEARGLIFTGDLIAVRGRHGILPALVRGVTGSPYTHTAVALWLDGGLYVAEMDGIKGVLVPLSQYADTDFDVFACPRDAVAERIAVKDAALAAIRTRIDYDIADLLRIAAWRTLRLPLPSRDRNGMVCSALSARIYRDVGLVLLGCPSIPAPDDLVAAFGGIPVLEVRA